MSRINASVSAIAEYTKENDIQYRRMLSIAEGAVSNIEYMLSFLEQSKERLEEQIVKLKEIDENIKEKLKFLKGAIEEIKYSRNDYSSRSLRELEEKLQIAADIKKEVAEKAELFQQHLKIICSIIEAITKNRLAAEKFTVSMADEADYNLRALAAVTEKLNAYVAVSAQKVTASAVGWASHAAVKASNVVSAQKETGIYKPEYGAFGYNTDGTRRSVSLYKAYSPQMANILYGIMLCLDSDLRDAVMERINDIIFMSTKHPFNYTRQSRGQTMRILGINVSDKDFSSRLLFHIGYHLYETNLSIEKLNMENAFSRESAKNSRSASASIRAISDNFKSKKLSSGRRLNRKPLSTPQTSEGIFFAKCFRAHSVDDKAFIAEVKEHYGESYGSFLKILNSFTRK